MGSKDDSYYVEKSLIELYAIINYTKGLSFEEFISDVKTIDATMFRLQQMIEHINQLSEDFKKKYEHIPWGEIVGFRNGIVHEYGATDYTTVYEVISKDIYELKELFELCLKSK